MSTAKWKQRRVFLSVTSISSKIISTSAKITEETYSRNFLPFVDDENKTMSEQKAEESDSWDGEEEEIIFNGKIREEVKVNVPRDSDSLVAE